MKRTVWAALAILLPGMAMAQAAPPVLAPPPVEARVSAETTVLPAGTQLVIEVDEQLDSYETRRGQKFRIHLLEAVMVGDITLLPAGLLGEGEIIHSEPAGDGGRPGELQLAARFLRYGDRRILLKGWRISAKGDETIAHGFRSITYTGYPAIVSRGESEVAEIAADFDLQRPMGVAPPAPEVPARLATLPVGLVSPAPGKAQVVFYRPGSMDGMLNWTKIRFGPGKGAEVGVLGTGGYITIDVPPGRHEFMVSQELGDEIYLDAEVGEIYYVAIRIQMGVWAGHPNLYPVNRPDFEGALGGMSRKKSVWNGG